MLYASTNRGNPIGVRLKMLAGRPARGPRADPWLTISAWLWAIYLAGVGAAGVWLLF